MHIYGEAGCGLIEDAELLLEGSQGSPENRRRGTYMSKSAAISQVATGLLGLKSSLFLAMYVISRNGCTVQRETDACEVETLEKPPALYL